MKVLIVSNMYPSKQKPYAGIFVKNQYEFLLDSIDEQDEIDIFTMPRVFTSAIGSVIKYIKASFRFTPYFFRKYHIIHLHFFYPLIILIYLYKKIYPQTKIVVTFHGSDITAHINGGLNQQLFAYLSTCIDVPIAVGDDLAKEINRKLNLKVKKVISAGVQETIFKPLDLKKQYDFIFVGSFIRRKGLDLLLEAIKLINNKRIRYCIVGSGILEKDVLELTDYDITLLKNQNQHELCQLYNQSKFFILPSRDEPFGLVATEAIFCSTPAIVSNVGGLKTQVIDDENGFVIKELIAQDIADCMLRAYNLSNDEYSRLVNKASHSNKEHSMDSVVNKLIYIYKND